MSESRSGESRWGYATSSTSEESSLEDIDALISRLEKKVPKNTSNSPKVQEAIDKRQQQLEELKQLRDEAKKKLAEEKLESDELERVEEDNDDLEEAIKKVKAIGTKKTTNKKHPVEHYSTASESHNSGESRW